MDAGAPCLRGDLHIVERTYRGETSYVVKDPAAQKYFRFGKTEISVMRLFDGHRTPREIAAALAAEGLRVSTEVVERFARKLGGAGFLERTLGEKSILQLERLRAERRKRHRAPLFRGELLRMRWSFGDPDALLDRVLPSIRWMFTPGFVAASVVVFAAYVILLAANWDAFGAALSATYAPRNLTLATAAIFWLTAGVVILIHELGHGVACKYFGGEVRELGFMILYFQPAFYCNVNDAWSFTERRARLWVTAAGSWIEFIVTALATFVWLIVQPGTLVADVAVATMLIGGVTTVLANMNPLLPLDGYFALADWLEIPNLRQRAFAHLAWWIKRRVFRLELPEPAVTLRERRVFLLYGALASLYIALMFAFLALLALGWVSRAFGSLGAAASVIALFFALRPRLMTWGRTVAMAVRARRATLAASPRRRWAFVALAGLVLMMFLPWTLTTMGTFVVRPAASSTVSAPDSGVVAQVLVSEGARVEAGAPVVRLVDRVLERELLAAARTVDSLATAETAAHVAAHPAVAARLGLDRQSATARLAALDRRLQQLTVRAVIAGVVVTPRPEDLVGRRVSPGDSLLAIANLDSVEARVSLGGGGATRARPGQVVHLVSYADVSAPWTGQLAAV